MKNNNQVFDNSLNTMSVSVEFKSTNAKIEGSVDSSYYG